MKALFDFDTGRKKAVLVSELLSDARNFFSVEDNTQKFKRRFAVGYRPQSRIYAISPQGRYDAGLTNEIKSHLKSLCPHIQFEYTDKFLLHTKAPTLDGDRISVLKYPLRDYQEECVQHALVNGSGVILLPTSAGKTLVMATIVASVQEQIASNFKTLILVPDIQLVEQSYSDLLEYGIEPFKVTKWTGNDIPDTNASIIISNSQILLSEKQDTSILQNIQMLIIDEVHKLKHSNKISKLVAKIPARIRYGLTGTMPDSNIDKWHIIGQMGDILYRKKSIDLREDKYITSVKVAVLKIEYLDPPSFKIDTFNPTFAYECELEFLQKNEFRNNTIKTIAQGLKRNALILVDRIAHGEVLLEYLKTIQDKEVHFICGAVEIEERERVRSLMESNDNVLCIAISKIFSTGINIKNLHYIIFASIGKARIKIIQSIGRSLRLHANKKQAVIFDIGDNLRYGINHLEERLSLYESESIPYNIKNIKQTP